MIRPLLPFCLIVLALSLNADAGIRDGKLECPVIRPIALGFVSNHVAARKIDLEHEGRTIERFIKMLDSQKIYLLESDVAEIRGSLRGMFKNLGADCSGIEKSHKLLTKRVQETLEFAKKTLTTDFKFLENTELVLNAEQRKFPASQKEAQDQMRKFIQFYISNYLASDMKLPKAKEMLIHRFELNAKRQVELKQDELYAIFLDSFATGLDAHSSYMAKDVVEDFEIQMRLSLEGIGAALTWDDGYTTVDNLIPGGSAERSGELEPKDKIIAVAQGNRPFEQVIDMPLRDVVKLIRGKKGTVVRLTVLRQGVKETTRHIITLTRDKIKLEDDAAALRYSNHKVGDKTLKIAIIELPSFYGDLMKKTRSCYEDVKKKLEQARKDKADGVIFDLSKNGGGLLTEAVRIAGLFINKGNIVATQNAKDQMDFLPDEDDTLDYGGPLIVLTSRLSASASEIVAGALQDYRRALIVGSDHTFGKGTVQAMMNLPAEMGAIKVTTGMFFVPGGQSTQFRGVPADIVLPSVFSVKDIGENSLDYPLPSKSVSAFLSSEANSTDMRKHWVPVTDSVIKSLKTASAERVAKNAEFKKIVQELADMEKQKGVIKLSDSLKKQKEEKADPKKKQLGRRGKKQSDEDYLKTPQVAEAVLIMGDMIEKMAAGSPQAAR